MQERTILRVADQRPQDQQTMTIHPLTEDQSQARNLPAKKLSVRNDMPYVPKNKSQPFVSKYSRRIAVDSDDDEGPETKVIQPVLKAKPAKSQPKSSRPTSNIEKTSQILSPSQLNNVKISSAKAHTKAKKTDVKPRQPARSSLVSNPKEIIDGDWPFAHFGVLQVYLNEKAGKRRSHKPRKHNSPPRLKEVGFNSLLHGLPAEVRNKIYEFVVPQPRILVCTNKPEKEKAQLQQAWENQDKYVKMPRSRLYCMMDRQHIKAGFETSAGLLLTCKQIKTEVELLMYSRTVFCFESPRTIDMFMANASKEGIKAIQSIELRCDGYGEPGLTAHIDLKQRHDLKWKNTYKRIKMEMISLNSLRLEMKLHDWPVKLDESEKWYKALMLLIQDKPLDTVRAFLKHDHFSEARMRTVACKLENRMMTKEGKLARDKQETIAVLKEVQARKEAEKAHRATLPPVQAKKVLKIRIEKYKIAPKKPVQTTKHYTQSVSYWEWRYGQGNTLGTGQGTTLNTEKTYAEGGAWKE